MSCFEATYHSIQIRIEINYELQVHSIVQHQIFYLHTYNDHLVQAYIYDNENFYFEVEYLILIFL